MKCVLSAALALLFLAGASRECQAQTVRPDTGRRAGSEAGNAAPVAADSLDFVKAIAINKGIFKNSGGQVFFSSGYVSAQYDGLNQALRQAGYPTIDGGQFSYGAGGSFRFKRFVLGMEGVLYETKKQDQNRKTELYSSNATNYLGYAWLNATQTQCFTPTIGVTYGSADITLTETPPDPSTSLPELLLKPTYTRVLHYRNTGLALGAHYEFYPFDAAVLKRCVVGLHLTYTARLSRGRYYADDYKQQLAGPALNPLQFSARGVFGFVF